MHIKRAKQEIKDSIEAYLKKDAAGNYVMPHVRQRPILLMGPPGIGKTQIMEQAARECGIGLVSYTITHHTRQSAVGLPFIREKEYEGRKVSVTEYTMSEIIASVYDKMEETGLREGILFIDEINCVSETLAPTMLQFLQCKTFGNQKLPEGWVIVAAGNPPEYNRSVREFDVVTLDRIKKIDVEENYEVWKEYAGQVRIHPAILAYLEIRRDFFYRMETTVDGKEFATARGWEDLSWLLKSYEALGKQADQEVVHQYIQHWKIAKDFAVYLELYKKYRKDYGFDGILEGKWKKETLEKLNYAAFDERLSVVSLLLSQLNDRFLSWGQKESFTELLYDYLKQYKESCQLEEVAGKAESDYEKLRRAELLNKDEDKMWQEVLGRFRDYLLLVRAEHLEGSAGFARVREEFAGETKILEAVTEETLEALNNGFRFMEEAFGDSQEMVVFVTELNTSAASIRFLKENDCDLYYRYNKKLLSDGQQQEILEDLSGLLS
ncbi:AAA family ATPase [Merdimonas faecis]